MSLRKVFGAPAAAIRAAKRAMVKALFKKAVETAVEEAREGTLGQGAQDAMKWINENKKAVGAAFAAIGAAAAYLGHPEVGGFLALIGSHIGIAGATKSDAEARASR